MKSLKDDPTQYTKMTFQHIYFARGFAVSSQFTKDGKEYKPNSIHGCMQSGYWCEKQIKEEGINCIYRFLKRHKIRNPKTVVKTIRKITK